jgi:hypothetical protein
MTQGVLTIADERGILFIRGKVQLILSDFDCYWGNLSCRRKVRVNR